MGPTPEETLLLARCRRIPTSIWSDALDLAGINGCLVGLTWRAGQARAAGLAVTVHEEVGSHSELPVGDFAVGAILKAAGPGQLLVIAMDGAVVSTIGGLAALGARQRAIEGLVVDGGCRDLDDLRATGFPVASRHVTPVSGKTRARVVEIGGPVTCCGVRVDPGDYIVMDETGVISIPFEHIDRVLAMAEDLDARERRIAEALQAGRELSDITAEIDAMDQVPVETAEEIAPPSRPDLAD